MHSTVVLLQRQERVLYKAPLACKHIILTNPRHAIEQSQKIPKRQCRDSRYVSDAQRIILPEEKKNNASAAVKV